MLLNNNPGKKRPPEDIKELDEKNKITKDMVSHHRACDYHMQLYIKSCD